MDGLPDSTNSSFCWIIKLVNFGLNNNVLFVLDSCGPPVGHYSIVDQKTVKLAGFDKASRWSKCFCTAANHIMKNIVKLFLATFWENPSFFIRKVERIKKWKLHFIGSRNDQLLFTHLCFCGFLSIFSIFFSRSNLMV